MRSESVGSEAARRHAAVCGRGSTPVTRQEVGLVTRCRDGRSQASVATCSTLSRPVTR